MNFHILGGTPRSGSTLLANVFSQNKKFHVSTTSPVCQVLGNISHLLSHNPEIKGLLHHDKNGTEKKMLNSTRAFIETWYRGHKIVLDKCRGWGHNVLVLKSLYPESRIILCVRDLRNIFGSIEKQHAKFPLLDEATSIEEKTQFSRADRMFSQNGIVGMPIQGLVDLLRKSPPNTIIVPYEHFAKSPQLIMERIYSEMKEPYFKHDFENVKARTGELDALYLHKYPHNGSGKIVESDPDEWKQYVSPEVAKLIMDRFTSYNQALGYK